MPYTHRGDFAVTRGLTLGRMTTAERVAYVPAEGTQVFDTDLGIPYIYSSSSWSEIGSAAVSTLIDSSGAPVAETLPAATGSGSVRFYSNVDVTGNSASLAPAAGESLNGVTDGTFLFSNYPDNTQFRADEIAAGEWVISVAGSSTQTDPVSTFDATLISAVSGTNYVANSASNPAAGQTSIDDGTLTRYGTHGVYTFDLGFDDDDTFVLEFSGIMPVGGRIVSFHVTPTNFAHEPYADINCSVTADTQVSINRDNGIDADCLWRVRMEVEGFENFGGTVLAGMVTPETLFFERSQLAATQTTGGTEATLTGVSVTIPAGGGRFRVGVIGHVYLGGDECYVYIKAQADGADLSPLLEFRGDSTDLSGVEDSFQEIRGSSFDVYDFLGGEVITLVANETSNGEIRTDTRLTVEQLPSSTVVLEDALVPEALSYYAGEYLPSGTFFSSGSKLAFGAGLTEVYSGGSSISYNSTTSEFDLQPGRYRIEFSTGSTSASANISTQIRRAGDDAIVSTDGQNSPSSSGEVGYRPTVAIVDISSPTSYYAYTVSSFTSSTIARRAPLIQITQLPTHEVVLAESVPVEDVEEVLFDQDLTNGGLFTLGSYADLAAVQAAGFDTLEFSIAATSTIIGVTRQFVSSRVRISDMDVNDDEVASLNDLGGNGAALRMTGVSGGEYLTFGTTYTGARVVVKAIKPQKTVIDSDAVAVDDQTASGYFDIGDMRMQWGTFTTGSNVTTALPAAFADNSYVVTASTQSTGDNPHVVSFYNKTTTQFESDGWKADDRTPAAFTAGWIAIGPKP